MPVLSHARLRRLWLDLWIGLGLAVLLGSMSISSALLVWHDHLDALIDPARYTVQEGSALPPSELLKQASPVLSREFQPVIVRMPESARWPATVSAREAPRRERHGRAADDPDGQSRSADRRSNGAFQQCRRSTRPSEELWPLAGHIVTL
jgi:uncharacterized iron-regulated membrane protein